MDRMASCSDMDTLDVLKCILQAVMAETKKKAEIMAWHASYRKGGQFLAKVERELNDDTTDFTEDVGDGRVVDVAKEKPSLEISKLMNALPGSSRKT